MQSTMIISALVSRPTLRINAGEKIEVIQAPTHWAPTKEEEQFSNGKDYGFISEKDLGAVKKKDKGLK